LDPHVVAIRRYWLPFSQYERYIAWRGTLGTPLTIEEADTEDNAMVVMWRNGHAQQGVRVAPVPKRTFREQGFDPTQWTLVVYWRELSGTEADVARPVPMDEATDIPPGPPPDGPAGSGRGGPPRPGPGTYPENVPIRGDSSDLLPPSSDPSYPFSVPCSFRQFPPTCLRRTRTWELHQPPGDTGHGPGGPGFPQGHGGQGTAPSSRSRSSRGSLSGPVPRGRSDSPKRTMTSTIQHRHPQAHMVPHRSNLLLRFSLFRRRKTPEPVWIQTGLKDIKMTCTCQTFMRVGLSQAHTIV